MFRRKQLPNFRRNITFVANVRTALHLIGTSRQIRNKQKSQKIINKKKSKSSKSIIGTKQIAYMHKGME
jgi:hypothetical protein